MEFIVDAKDLVKAVRTVAPARPSKHPVESCTKYYSIEASNGTIHLAATDLDTWVIASCPGTIIEPGTGLLPVKVTRVIRWVDSTVTISINNRKLICTIGDNTGAGTVTYNMDDTEDYPPVPPVPDIFPIHFDDLPERLRQVCYAMGNQEYRPVLHGVCIRDGHLIANDEYRLAIAPLAMTGTIEESIIPASAVMVLSQFNGPMDAAVDKGHIIFRTGSTYIWVTLWDGKYPSIAKMHPTHPTLFSCPTQPLLQALVGIKTEYVLLRASDGVLNVISDDGSTSYTIPGVEGAINNWYTTTFLVGMVEQMGETVAFHVSRNMGPTMAIHDGVVHMLMPATT